MSNKTAEKETGTTEKASEVAKKIWLAGLGAYGKAFDGASDQMDKLNEQYEKVSKETSQFFEDLVVKGKKLDDESHDKLVDAKEKTSTTIEERISKVRSSLNLSLSSGSSDIEALNDKIDALAAKVDALLDASTPAKKTTTKKAASSAA